LAIKTNYRARSLGVAFDGCTLPGATDPLFHVPAGQMSLGLGIHGEPGISEHPMPTASELAELLVTKLLADKPEDAGARVVAIVNGATIERSRWFIPSPKLDIGRAGFKTVVNDTTPNVGQTIRVTALARDTWGRPVAGLQVTWTWDLGRTTARTSGITNAFGKAYSTRLITSSLTSGTVSIKAHVQAYSLNRYAYTSFNRN